MQSLVRSFICVLVAAGLSLLVQAGVAGAATVSSEAAIARVTSAALEAQIDPEGHDTTCVAEYVNAAHFAESGWSGAGIAPCSPTDLGAGTSEVAATAALIGLQIDTTYHYRFTTSSEGKALPGPEDTFATFGIELFSFEALDESNQPFTQAGGHPFELTTYIAANTTQYKGKVSPDAVLKDALTQLPAGLIGDPDAMPKCTARVVEEQRCSAASEVGVVTAYHGSEKFGPRPLFDTVAPRGIAARFAGEVNGSIDAYIDASVRNGGDYGVTAGSQQLPEFANATAFRVTLWGVPNAASHNNERWCLEPSGSGYKKGCEPEGEPRPFLSMPTACLGPQSVTAELDSYQAPGEYVSKTASMPPNTGCSQVPFAPSIAAQPTTGATDSPSGLKFDLHVPQSEDPNRLASADLKAAAVRFPPGLVVNPSSADGLGACSETNVGFTGFAELDPTAEPGVRTAQFTPGPAQCPDSSKLGTVEVDTPLLDHPLPGALYLAGPHANPFGSLLAVYLTVYDPISGVVVKLPGLVQADPVTGQLTSTFEQNPQLPFEDLRVDLFAESRASLTTPSTCGLYTTTTDLTPWTSPEGADATLSASFALGEGAGGGACASSEGELANSPGFEAGTASPIAGSYSPFVLSLRREDGSQRFAALDVRMPPGLLGKIAGIEQCPQGDIERAQARSHEGEGAVEQADPSCPAGSEVGTVHVGSGSGAPYYVIGHAYFAGPYEGAPFSLVFVTPAIAGPFDLGTVVVRSALYIDAYTSQVSAKSDPFPTILDGIPLDIRSIAVDVTRSQFVFNPTNCATMAVTGRETSTTGQAAPLSDRFQVGGCTTLPFHPSFRASTQGSTSKRDGASLAVDVSEPAGSSNIREVKVSLPRQLPSRLETLKLACREAVFATDPASCPAASAVGTAVASTPILSKPLTGPAYIVSHGGAGFPDVEIVLQGEGITLILDGKTDINEKTNVTTSTFSTLPDAPVNSFSLTLPEGPYSVLGAPGGNLCSQTLSMPTRIRAQNGALIEHPTKIAITGCKPTIRILSHNTNGATATLRVSVPGAGRLTATGHGLRRTRKHAKHAQTLTLKLALTATQRRFLTHHHGRKLRTRIHLRFTPTHGHTLTANTTLLVG